MNESEYPKCKDCDHWNRRNDTMGKCDMWIEKVGMGDCRTSEDFGCVYHSEIETDEEYINDE